MSEVAGEPGVKYWVPGWEGETVDGTLVRCLRGVDIPERVWKERRYKVSWYAVGVFRTGRWGVHGPYHATRDVTREGDNSPTSVVYSSLVPIALLVPVENEFGPVSP